MADTLAIDKANLQARAYAALRKGLMTGRFQPGQKLLLRPLAEELGISVTPVREAMLQLVSEHALASDSSRSLSVPAIGLRRFVEIRDLRIELEGRAAEAAAGFAGPADVAGLRELQRTLAGHRRTGQFAQALSTNELFHFAVYRLARMPVLYRIIEGLWVQIGPVLTRLYNQAGAGAIDRQHPHDLMILALERHDGLAARHAVATDIMWACRHLEPTLATHPSPDGDGPGEGGRVQGDLAARQRPPPRDPGTTDLTHPSPDGEGPGVGRRSEGEPGTRQRHPRHEPDSPLPGRGGAGGGWTLGGGTRHPAAAPARDLGSTNPPPAPP